jgi:hypothetical protein
MPAWVLKLQKKMDMMVLIGKINSKCNADAC